MATRRPAPAWDPLLTITLLVLGVVNVTQTVAQARDLPDALQAVYTTQGVGEFTSVDTAISAGWIVIAANVACMVLAIGFAVPRIRQHRLAFWIPLVSAAIAVLVTVSVVMAVVVGDPAFASYLRRSA